VSPSTRDGFQVDYLFAQVGVTLPFVDWTGSCGNLAAAVGPFAIDEGLVIAQGEMTTVRIWQQNTSKEIIASVPTADESVVVDGDLLLDGLPYPAAAIRLDFLDPGGAITGKLLPTGNPADMLEVADVGVFQVTMLDAGNPCVFVAASDLGLSGVELPSQLNSDPNTLGRLEAIRAHAAVAMGIAQSAQEATRACPANPKVAMVCSPRTHTTSSGRMLEESTVDLVVRMLSMGKLHHAVPATGAMAVALAARIEGSVPYRAARASDHGAPVCIGHSSGMISVEVEVARRDGRWEADRVTFWRSARRLMEGSVLVPRSKG
jgi:2-methylaconitate cis-trans-isomerase PrpF